MRHFHTSMFSIDLLLPIKFKQPSTLLSFWPKKNLIWGNKTHIDQVRKQYEHKLNSHVKTYLISMSRPFVLSIPMAAIYGVNALSIINWLMVHLINHARPLGVLPQVHHPNYKKKSRSLPSLSAEHARWHRWLSHLSYDTLKQLAKWGRFLINWRMWFHQDVPAVFLIQRSPEKPRHRIKAKTLQPLTNSNPVKLVLWYNSRANLPPEVLLWHQVCWPLFKIVACSFHEKSDLC